MQEAYAHFMQRLAWKCGTWRLPPDQSNPKILTVAVRLSPRILYVRLPSRTPVSNSIDYAKFRSRSHDAVIRVYDDDGDVIGTHKAIPRPPARFTAHGAV